MKYSIFLDDERFPSVALDHPQIIVRNYRQFLQTIQTLGFPFSISFDNDLGEEKEGKHCAQWLLSYAMQRDVTVQIPSIQFYVHSQNPIAAKEIAASMGDYHKYIQIHDQMFTQELERMNNAYEKALTIPRRDLGFNPTRLCKSDVVRFSKDRQCDGPVFDVIRRLSRKFRDFVFRKKPA